MEAALQELPRNTAPFRHQSDSAGSRLDTRYGAGKMQRGLAASVRLKAKDSLAAVCTISSIFQHASCSFVTSGRCRAGEVAGCASKVPHKLQPDQLQAA